MTTGALHESRPYLDQLKSIQNTLQCLIQVAIADRAFGSGEILKALLQYNIIPIIPLFSGRSGGFVVTEKEGFYYEEKYDRYRCPAGYYLVPYKASTDTIKYHTQDKVCKYCPLRSICPAKRFKQSQVRFVCRNKYQSVFEVIEQAMITPSFVAQQKERFWKMEGIIGEAKNRHCLARAKYRGLTKVQIQAYLSASVQNMKRLIAFYRILLVYFYASKLFRRSLYFYW